MERPKSVAAALRAIGGTPLVPLRRLAPVGGAEVWAKWEGANPTGSMKDRMGLGLVEGAERRGELRPGMRVVEYTGGSTGSSLAMVCAAMGYEARLVTSDAFAREKIRTMQAFGATVDVVPSDGGAVTPELFDRMQARVHELLAEGNTHWTRQFESPDNAAGYHGLGREILEQTGGRVDAFVMGVGTGGCFSGVAEVLTADGRHAHCVAVEPATSRNLSGGRLGPHRLEGIGVGFVPPRARLDLAAEVAAVSDEEAFETARALARVEGLLAGTTSGANVCAALRLAGRMRPGQVVVTVLVDSGLRYLAGDLYA